tara:strand:+ start:573 stop:881 length:309 start_codon:yes stop_codon:yes gene_type:complete
MKKRIHEIICDLLGAIQETGLDVRKEVIFEEACCIYRGEVAGGYKPNKVTQNGSNQSQDTSDKPTDKQIKFLEKHKVKIPPTKKAATEMISTFIENQTKEAI